MVDIKFSAWLAATSLALWLPCIAPAVADNCRDGFVMKVSKAHRYIEGGRGDIYCYDAGYQHLVDGSQLDDRSLDLRGPQTATSTSCGRRTRTSPSLPLSNATSSRALAVKLIRLDPSPRRRPHAASLIAQRAGERRPCCRRSPPRYGAAWIALAEARTSAKASRRVVERWRYPRILLFSTLMIASCVDCSAALRPKEFLKRVTIEASPAPVV